MVIMSMKTYEETLYLNNVYSKLAQAENEIRSQNTVDARRSLQELRGKYGI